MAGPLAKILAQALVVVGSVAGRAFLQAYQQAAQQAKQGGKGAAQKATKTFRKRMKREEALKVLNFSEAIPPTNVSEVMEQYNRYFTANDPKNGGSFYLQSKIYRAKETLEKDFSTDTETEE